MRKYLQILLVALATVVALSSCSKEKTGFGGGEDPVVESECGFLTFGEECLTVISDVEIVRSSMINVDTFTCSIVSEKTGAEVMRFLYGDRPTEPIELKVGSYKLNVSSGEIPQLAWESPTYGATVPFTIQKGQTNTLETIKCKLSNIKVTVGYDVELSNLLEEGSKSTVTIGANAMEFPYTERRAAYFFAPEEENNMVVDMELTYAGKSSKMSTTIAGVKPGQWRAITINMPHINEGNVVFTITIETMTLDEEIIVDINEVLLTEELIDDGPVVNPLAPIISWTGHDLNEIFQLKKSHFDEEGYCTVPVVIDMNANQSTFTSVVVNVESTSEAFMESLLSMNFKEEFDLCLVTPAGDPNLNTALSMVGIPTGSKVKGKESVSVPLTTLMPILYNYTGTHTFTLTVTNAEGHTASQPIVMLVDPASEDGSASGEAPQVVWRDHDISKPYAVTRDLQVILDVTAAAGIAKMEIDIVSDLLTPEELEGVGLVPHLDLINPGAQEESLNGLGFPTGSAVKNQTSLTFDISAFMGILSMIGQPGQYANFVLSVTDNNGVNTTAALQLYFN